MDQITIKDLEVYCHHGMLKEENVLGQKFLVTAKLQTDIHQAGQADEIRYSINYAQVSHFIEEYMKNHTFKLIETVAEQLSQELLLQFSLIERIVLEVKKPWAPILLPLDTVSVMVERGWHHVALSVGSNIGDREKYIKDAIERLKNNDRIKNVRCSKLIETKPYGYTEQDDFINGAIVLDTLYEPFELLNFLHEVETAGNRTREIHWGPRTIDLDLLLYDNLIMQTEELTIPHREMHLRSFVLDPLVELEPWLIHPVLNKTIMELQGGKSND